MNKNKRTRLIVGCMTGTSIDGIDAALLSIEDSGLKLKAKFIKGCSDSFGDWSKSMRAFASQSPLSAGKITELALKASNAHCVIIKELLGNVVPDLIVIHGQTVFHKPPLSWQLANPWQIALEFNAPVLFDLRSADIAAGGQGAPITPIADFILFRNVIENRAVVNLGGFCNITYIPNWSNEFSELSQWLNVIKGYDVCVCNRILNDGAKIVLKRDFDPNGKYASQGNLNKDIYHNLINSLKRQSRLNRSLGTGDELNKKIKYWATNSNGNDLLRTINAAIAHTIVNAIGEVDLIIIAGGGAKNLTLINEIRHRAKVPVKLSDDFGIPHTYREAAAMAILGALCEDRIPITLPNITKANQTTVSGCWCNLK